jgi:hypothetical protein
MWHGLAMRVHRVILFRPLCAGAYVIEPRMDRDERGLLVCARMDKDQVADVLVDIGLLLELKDGNLFKTRVYQNAAHTVQHLNEPLLEGGRSYSHNGI